MVFSPKQTLMSFLTRVKGMLQIEQLKCVVYKFPSEVVRCIYPGRRDRLKYAISRGNTPNNGTVVNTN